MQLTSQERCFIREILNDAHATEHLQDEIRTTFSPLVRALPFLVLKRHESLLDGYHEQKEGEASKRGGTELKPQCQDIQ